MASLQFGYVLLLLLTFQFIVQATNSSNALAHEEPAPGCVNNRSTRTLFNIVWGCLSTTIVCAWAALHPNIPPQEEGPLKGALRRLELMVWTLLAPEILPSWALNQRLAAMTVRDVYNGAKGYKQDGIWKRLKGYFSLSEIKGVVNPAWTLKHGHFLIMGGIHLVEPGGSEGDSSSSGAGTEAELTSSDITIEPRNTSSVEADTEKGCGSSENPSDPEEGTVTILTLEILRELVKKEVTGDELSKAIFILQSSWFILQCIARRAQGLDLTQLELTTLALASLNGITFILWWDKPLGAQTIVRVYLKRNLTNAERNVEGRGNSQRSVLIRKWLTTSRDIFLCRANECIDWFYVLPISILFLLFPILAPIDVFLCTIFDLLGKSTSFPIDATHVPTFYVPAHHSSGYHILILVLFGTIFGGIHCAGWNFPFPTYAERTLWRVASLGVTVIPFGVIPFIFIVIFIVKTPLVIVRSNSDADEGLGGLFLLLAMVAYACARLVLLGQAIALLRHLPPSAFIAVDWSQFYPHFL